MVSGTTLWEYAAFAAIVFVLPFALLACAGVASGGVSPRLRSVALVLLTVGALVLLRQVRRTGVGELMLPFAVPVLVAAAIVYPLAALTVVRAASGRTGRLASARSAVALLAAAALVQFAGPWLLTSGK
jgi:hypothetical protein